MKLPSNRSKNPLYRDKSLDQIIAMRPKNVMKTPTINKQLSRVGAMFNWAVGEGYILGNPIKGKSLRDNSRIDDARNPFSLADLVKIFTPLKKYLHSYLLLDSVFGTIYGGKPQ